MLIAVILALAAGTYGFRLPGCCYGTGSTCRSGRATCCRSVPPRCWPRSAATAGRSPRPAASPATPARRRCARRPAACLAPGAVRAGVVVAAAATTAVLRLLGVA
ncbi:AzlD domain-containing protein [Micromonospora sp. b486]|uniref:AzlD domain-containing protein n=1 Tax=Micromonospora sp. b486 TaxID=3053986 RepID=UPI00259C78EF|nr:AzlD domain-containing protein [Micromonospora sp. b486]MDM4784608.1 AzlD domain-containing protein [Micromonospora sp. b486]